MNSSEEEQIYSIALTMVPGIGHIGAKHLIDGMGNAVDVFRLRKEMPERIPEVSQRVIEALDCPQLCFAPSKNMNLSGRIGSPVCPFMMKLILPVCGNVKMLLSFFSLKEMPI